MEKLDALARWVLGKVDGVAWNFDRWIGLSFVVAGIGFWLTWALMPDAGTTDAVHILQLMQTHRARVQLSSWLQILSSAAFATALVPWLWREKERCTPSILWGACLLLIGAMGMAADAVYHQIGYEMAAPGVSQTAMVPVMHAMQTRQILSLIPLILCFFVGLGVFAFSTDYAGIFPGGRWWLIGAFATLGLGLPGAASGLLSRKLLALCFLGLCAAYLVYIGLQQRNRSA